MKKRALIFSLAYYPSHVSGAEAAVREITNRIDDIEFELITLHFDKTQPKKEHIGNVLVHRVGFGTLYVSKVLFIPIAAITAWRLHKQNPFTCMWALMTYMMVPLVFARMLGVRVPYVVTLQDGDSYDKVFARWFIRPITPLLDYGFRHATVVQAISTHLATWPKKRGSNTPVVLIHNGANPNDFKKDVFTKEALRKARENLGVRDTDVLIGNTARLVHQKGWEDAITALTYLPEHVKMLVVGGGPEEQTYKGLVDTLGLGKRVIFVGQVDRSEVTKYRRMLDVFVMPSRSEGLGNAGLSAMASRIPVVATQVGGLAEYVFDAKRNSDAPTTAWAVDPGNPKQIATAIEYIMHHPDEVRNVTETAYRMVEKEYQWDAVAQAMRHDVFDKVCRSNA